MKICLLSVYHEAFDKRMYHKIARSLVGADHLVVSICPQGAFDGEERDGVHFRYIPRASTLYERLRSVFYLAAAGRKEEADIYIAPEPESWVAAMLIKAIGGGRIVYDMHEHASSKFARYFPAAVRTPAAHITQWFMRRFAGYTDHILLTRESFETVWEGLDTPRSVVINSNHRQAPCSDIPPAVRERVGRGPSVIHQGLFGDIRGSWQLLDAMKLVVRTIPDARCIILGEYGYGSLKQYRQAVANAGLEENFVFIDTVPYEEVPAYVATAQVGLILFQPGRLNHTLAMPHKLFDYMREGIPVIAPDFAVEVAHILDQADAGILVEITDSGAIAAAIIRLLEDPALSERLGKNGQAAVDTSYNWERDEVTLLRAIDSLGTTSTNAPLV